MKIKVRKDCPQCTEPIDSKFTEEEIFDNGVCRYCHGQGYEDEWVDLRELIMDIVTDEYEMKPIEQS